MRDPTKLNYTEVFGVENLQKIFSTISDHWILKLLVGLLCGVNDWFFHPNHAIVEVVSVLVLLDTVTGLLKAYRQHTISSSGFFRFALKLAVYLVLLATAALLDKVIQIPLMSDSVTLMAAFLSVTEAISIMENIGALGFAIPAYLLKILKFSQGQSSNSLADNVNKEVPPARNIK